MALGIEVDQHLHLGEVPLERRLHVLHDVVRVVDGQVAIDLHVELREIVRARAPRAEVVNALQPRLARGHVQKGAALILRPFLVHQLVDRVGRGADRAPGEPGGDRDAEDRVGAVPAEQLVQRQRDDHRAVEQDVRLIVDVVRQDRDRPGLADHAPLIGKQQRGGRDRQQRHADAQPDLARRGLRVQRAHRAPRDADRGDGDQHDLEQRCQRLRLTMAEAMVVVRRLGRQLDPVQRYQAGEQVQPGVGEAAQHRDRPGLPGRDALGREQEQRGADAEQRRANGERDDAAALVLRHGNSIPSRHPAPSCVNTRRSCSRKARSCQNSMTSGATR